MKHGDEIIQQIKQVQKRAAVARRIVEIFDTDLFKPEKGNVQERSPELESLLDQIEWPNNRPANFQERALELESVLGQIKWLNNLPASE